MSSAIFKKCYVILTAVQMVFSLVALFVISFIWNDSNVYIQLGYKGYGWQTLIIAFLIAIWAINTFILLAQISGKNLFQIYGKYKLLILYGICALMVIAAASLEIWNSKLAANAGNEVLHPRFVIAAVLCWLLVLTHLSMIITLIFI